MQEALGNHGVLATTPMALPVLWRSEALMFAAADLRKPPVEFFLETDKEHQRFLDLCPQIET